MNERAATSAKHADPLQMNWSRLIHKDCVQPKSHVCLDAFNFAGHVSLGLGQVRHVFLGIGTPSYPLWHPDLSIKTAYADRHHISHKNVVNSSLATWKPARSTLTMSRQCPCLTPMNLLRAHLPDQLACLKTYPPEKIKYMLHECGVRFRPRMPLRHDTS